MTAFTAKDRPRSPLPVVIAHMVHRIGEIETEPLVDPEMRAVLHATGRAIQLSSIPDSRLAAKRKRPRPAHLLCGDVE